MTWELDPKAQRALVAVNLVLCREGTRYLYVRRANTNWFDGHWNFPAGHVDERETPIEAAIREAREELGIVVQPEDCEVEGVIHQAQGFMDLAYIDYFILLHKWEGEPRNCEKKADRLEWTDTYPSRFTPQLEIWRTKRKGQGVFMVFVPAGVGLNWVRVQQDWLKTVRPRTDL